MTISHLMSHQPLLTSQSLFLKNISKRQFSFQLQCSLFSQYYRQHFFHNLFTLRRNIKSFLSNQPFFSRMSFNTLSTLTRQQSLHNQSTVLLNHITFDILHYLDPHFRHIRQRTHHMPLLTCLPLFQVSHRLQFNSLILKHHSYLLLLANHTLSRIKRKRIRILCLCPVLIISMLYSYLSKWSILHLSFLIPTNRTPYLTIVTGTQTHHRLYPFV
jgi:hypothetical protein